MKEKTHVGFWRHGINKTDASSTFPLTVPIILDHPVVYDEFILIGTIDEEDLENPP